MVDSSRESGITADRPFHVMAMPTGPACNLDCEYCYYLEKSELYPERANFAMTDETLEAFIEQYIESQPGPRVTFAWQGGEPTLRGLDFYRTVVDLQNEYAPAGKRIVNTIQTNGTRIDEEWCQFFVENDFLVGISIDGPQELHNRYRRTRDDRGTFEEVMGGLSLLQKYDIDHNVLCVVNSVNSQHPLRVYEFFKDNGVKWIQFIPLVETTTDCETSSTALGPPHLDADSSTERVKTPADRIGYDWIQKRVESFEDNDPEYGDVVERARGTSVTDRSVDPEQYGEFMRMIFDEWVRNDVGEVSVRLFDQCLEVAVHGEASFCIFQETCGDQVAMEHSGDIYSCDHFVDPGFKLGNIHDRHLVELLESDEQRQFGAYKRDGLPNRCQECNVIQFCHGGCPKNRHIKTPSGEFGLNYLCPSYRWFFSYIQPYLVLFKRKYEEEMPLSMVMDEVSVLDRHSESNQ